MRYRLIRYSEAAAIMDRIPLFLFSVFQKRGNVMGNVIEELRPPDDGVRFTIRKEVSGVFFCYVGDMHLGYTPQSYEFIAIPETHPLFNYKHASRNAPGRDVAHSQSRQLMELQAFSIKEVQKLQELFTTT